MDFRHIKSTLERAGVNFQPGLSSAEVKAAEDRFSLAFPDDLREFLMFALPSGERFPNWRNPEDPEIARALGWPLEGIWFDVQQNGFWPAEWGTKPDDESAAYEVIRKRVAAAPKLIPIIGHRYMPDRPAKRGNPVFSVYQTDIIHYGSDLENYLHNEFYHYFGTPPHRIGETRTIEFWSSFVE
ncbi:SMI1/KNR4 family protein [Piscinibacter terrae]|uniref:SMI1/KNR4 family protein n=1 Tax=Piscinibacter terrae TaxID=2496871 RepID=A0A3N7HPX5_9BURK|nr:SMI1/KNR4 family protein [Albitalea terrae]RQP24224.1 SMI1/KNR4 family protein [Albitalea terrae]